MAPRNPYEVLGVARGRRTTRSSGPTASSRASSIPDRNPDDAGAEERFKDVQAAYDILSDTEKRAAYDRFGESGARGFPGGQGRWETVDLGDLSDMLGSFGSFFGRGGSGAGRVPARSPSAATISRLASGSRSRTR